MESITIAQAKGMVANMPIPRITGKIKVLWDVKSGQDYAGELWSLQSGILKDENDEIKFTLSGCPSLPYSQGTNLIFRCKEGKKGLTGVKIKIYDYKGQKEPVLWITPTAIVLSDTEASDEIPMEFNAKTQETKQNAPQVNVARKNAIPEDGVQLVKKSVMQYANLREICDHAASFLYQEEQSGMVEKGIVEKIKDVSSCFFIQGIRDGLHLKLPNNKPLSKVKDVKEDVPEDLSKKEDEIF